MLKNGPKVKLYTRKMCVQEILENFIQSQKARKTYYLYSEMATYMSSGKRVKGNNIIVDEKMNENKVAYLVN